MKLQNLGQLHKIYNFKGTIILCETFEQHCSHLQHLLKFNSRKYNSVSPFSNVFIGTKVTVVLPCLQILNMSECLRRN